MSSKASRHLAKIKLGLPHDSWSIERVRNTEHIRNIERVRNIERGPNAFGMCSECIKILKLRSSYIGTSIKLDLYNRSTAKGVGNGCRTVQLVLATVLQRRNRVGTIKRR